MYWFPFSNIELYLILDCTHSSTFIEVVIIVVLHRLLFFLLTTELALQLGLLGVSIYSIYTVFPEKILDDILSAISSNWSILKQEKGWPKSVISKEWSRSSENFGEKESLNGSSYRHGIQRQKLNKWRNAVVSRYENQLYPVLKTKYDAYKINVWDEKLSS